MKEPREGATESSVGLERTIADEDLYQGAEFTEAEWRRLVFLRWLCRTGRLTEWP